MNGEETAKMRIPPELKSRFSSGDIFCYLLGLYKAIQVKLLLAMILIPAIFVFHLFKIIRSKC
ncbi:hypothetical protein HMPREF9103_01319 [Lentilactobacillus parafarraginis F0439]|uniref:Uncharacterized protein n=1 Tax=Lentilactobacillus parafarraginis F0439 TaxID=797515 RepID=G9ZNL6_9LACO|nr:hypothetical protein HMPREF9103_01319 [Lentilactobacillus parafarraginis F0439]